MNLSSIHASRSQVITYLKAKFYIYAILLHELHKYTVCHPSALNTLPSLPIYQLLRSSPRTTESRLSPISHPHRSLSAIVRHSHSHSHHSLYLGSPPPLHT